MQPIPVKLEWAKKLFYIYPNPPQHALVTRPWKHTHCSQTQQDMWICSSVPRWKQSDRCSVQAVHKNILDD